MTPRRWAFCGTFESPAEVAWTDLFTAERTCEENRVRVGRHVYTQLHARRTPALIGVFQRLQDLAGGTLEPRNPALDARITADPDDEAALAVYADWLLEQGHPRGFAATATGSALAELVAENGPELGTPDGTASVTWRWGFWDRVALFPTAPLADDADTAYHDARRVLRHPSARFVRSLAIGGADPLPPGLLEPVLRALSEVSLPCVERLAIAAGPRAFVSDTLDPRRFPRLREADLDVERVDPAVRGMLAGRLGR
ncbi:MAG: TIGR02996 domain-containing protein [Alphaproteobacteria bacterium]|nr:TIGR02996 domain-containing protein [Alphaproteobacteria bacterium]